MTKQSRRAILAALATAPIAGVPGVAHPDAELLRLGEDFEKRHAAWRPVDAECKRIEGPIGANFDAWLKDEMCLEAALDAEERAFNLIEAVTAKIRETPAKTFSTSIRTELLPFGSAFARRQAEADDLLLAAGTPAEGIYSREPTRCDMPKFAGNLPQSSECLRHSTCKSSATSSLWRCVSVLAKTDFN